MQRTARNSPRSRRTLGGPVPASQPGSLAFRVALALAFAGAAHAQGFELISVSSSGTAANGASRLGNGSKDGRFIAFESSATNLVASDTNGSATDIFVFDRTLQATELVSRWTTGVQGTSASSGTISDDGNFVAFHADGMPDGGDVYRRERAAGTTTGLTSNNATFDVYTFPSISSDGNFIAYHRRHTLIGNFMEIGVWSLVAGVPDWSVVASQLYGPSNLRIGPPSRDGRALPYAHQWNHAFGTGSNMTVVDPQTGQESAFNAPNATVALFPLAISGDGRFLVYWQDASPRSLRVRDTQLGLDQQVDVTLDGSQTSQPQSASISDDGRWIAFTSSSGSLVPGDTNGVTDAFVRDHLLGRTWRVSVDANGAQLSQPTSRVWLAPGGGFLLVETFASLLPTDTNTFNDIYRVRELLQYPDTDLDTYGAGSGQLRALPVVAGWSLVGGDCDDTNPARNPAAVETCNGVDDDCDGQVDEVATGQGYCVPGLSPNFCVPRITANGCPSVSQPSGLILSAHDLMGQRSGLFAYSTSAQQVPLAAGNPSALCIAAPIQRMGLQSSGGTAGLCNGAFSRDFLAWVASHPGALHTPLAAGTTLYFQAYVREPAYPKAALLTDGWQVTLTP